MKVYEILTTQMFELTQEGIRLGWVLPPTRYSTFWTKDDSCYVAPLKEINLDYVIIHTTYKKLREVEL